MGCSKNPTISYESSTTSEFIFSEAAISQHCCPRPRTWSIYNLRETDFEVGEVQSSQMLGMLLLPMGKRLCFDFTWDSRFPANNPSVFCSFHTVVSTKHASSGRRRPSSFSWGFPRVCCLKVLLRGESWWGSCETLSRWRRAKLLMLMLGLAENIFKNIRSERIYKQTGVSYTYYRL